MVNKITAPNDAKKTCRVAIMINDQQAKKNKKYWKGTRYAAMPTIVATPLPPLNFKNSEYALPISNAHAKKIGAFLRRKEDAPCLNNNTCAPYKKAKAFTVSISKIMTKKWALASVRATLVAPMLPEPCCII